eukprot:1102145-Amorphochlora_amoeboformis.AAC.1
MSFHCDMRRYYEDVRDIAGRRDTWRRAMEPVMQYKDESPEGIVNPEEQIEQKEGWGLPKLEEGVP